MYYLVPLCSTCLTTKGKLIKLNDLNEDIVSYFYNNLINTNENVTENSSDLQYICEICYKNLESSYNFWSQCTKNTIILRGYVYNLTCLHTVDSHVKKYLSVDLSIQVEEMMEDMIIKEESCVEFLTCDVDFCDTIPSNDNLKRENSADNNDDCVMIDEEDNLESLMKVEEHFHRSLREMNKHREIVRLLNMPSENVSEPYVDVFLQADEDKDIILEPRSTASSMTNFATNQGENIILEHRVKPRKSTNSPANYVNNSTPLLSELLKTTPQPTTCPPSYSQATPLLSELLKTTPQNIPPPPYPYLTPPHYVTPPTYQYQQPIAGSNYANQDYFMYANDFDERSRFSNSDSSFDAGNQFGNGYGSTYDEMELNTVSEYYCYECHEYFDDSYSFKSHMLIHDSQKLYPSSSYIHSYAEMKRYL